MRYRDLSCALAILFFSAAWVAPASEATEPAAMATLRENCFRCHGEEKTSSRLDLRTLDTILTGGKRGPAIVPGKPEVSRLVEVLQPSAKPHMPPGKKQLSPEQIDTVASWIASLDPDLLPRNEDTVKAAHSSPDSASHPDESFVPPGINPSLAIDFFVAARWQQRGVKASPLCDDATFARRLYLDLIGRIPTANELDTFLGDTDSQKRDRLIEQLLDHPEFSSHMADVFDVLLMGRGDARNLSRRQRHGWREYLETSFAENRPWDQMAREMVLARNTEQTDVRAGWFLYERGGNHQDIAEAISPNFFGLRIECAQCHDHPLASEIEQAHYWGLVAFFNRGKNEDTPNGPRVVESAVGGFNQFADLSGDSQAAALTFFASPVVPEAIPEDEEEEDKDENYRSQNDGIPEGEPRVPRFSRREKFAEEILEDHPLLARAFVNRLWALLLGRGIVHPFDRMDSMHPPSHPRLLDWLAEDFRQHGHDVQRLVRSIVASRRYQLESLPADQNALPEDFAYALDKPLIAESLLASMHIALTGEASPPPEELLREFRRTFPDVMPDEPTATLGQALLLSNHLEWNALLLSERAKTVEIIMSLTDPDMQAQQAFWIVFGRTPDSEEATVASDYLRQRGGSREAVAQLLWAMVTSAEFRMNH